MATILIAEDDKSIQLLVAARLKSNYTVICANDGQEALEIIESQRIDLLIADIMMPRMDGFRLVKTIREDGFTLPVLMLTAKQSFDDKRTGFSSGTDDYMTKPVNYEELHWRIEALLRRARIASENKIALGNVVLDSTTYTVKGSEQVIELPKKEFELLYKLLSYPGQIFTKNQLLDDIWGYDSESAEDTVKTHISRLRNKFQDVEEFKIITIKGLGYKAEITGDKTNA
jgi:Response regulators consisting of a CheY-like receiver domain and a winged-helix DNA-binding domain